MKKRSFVVVLAVLALASVVAACGGAAEPTPVGDAAAGETLFKQTIIGAQPGCATCHSLEADQVLVGPSLAGVGTRAETRVDGMTAEAYIRESILHPDNYVVDGFQPGIMVQVWEEELTPDQVDNLVAFLLTQ